MKKRLNWGTLSEYRNVIYGLSCISIILFHYATTVPEGTNLKSMLAYVFKGVVGSIGVEIFILMSGICMYFSFKSNSSVMDFYRKRFIRLIIPFILIVFPFYFYKDIIMANGDIKRVLYDLSYASFFTEGNISVWYILCIAIMYLMYPGLYKTFEKYDKYRHAMLAILLGAAIAVNLIIYAISPVVFVRIEIMTMRLPIYIIGVYLGKKVYEKAKFTKSEIGIFIVGIAIKLLIDYLRYLETITIPYFLIRYVNLNSSLVILGLTLILLAIFKVNKNSRILVKCGALSLELYLVHVTLMNILQKYKYPIHRYSYFALYMLVTIILSVVVNVLTNVIVKGLGSIVNKINMLVKKNVIE
ncbi:MAG: acyltransferase [Lachnospiraceae bacterium]|nr:acyltransferase [Lachnospiraceae bacterium]